MKKIWLVLLSLGLIMVFGASAFAVDVNVSGSYYVGGLYLNKVAVADNGSSPDPSTAFFYQRLRVETDFIVSPGLKLITRFDALERVWGGARSAPTSGSLTPVSSLAVDSAGTVAENENIAFDWAYIDYTSPIGTFDVGYQEVGSTGTVFGNSTTPGGRIKYTSLPLGPFIIKADITKVADNSYYYNNPVSYTNADDNQYGLEGIYQWKDGKAGMKIQFNDYADPEQNSTPSSEYAKKYFVFTPYVIAKIGPVNVQAEVNYATGKYKQYDSNSGNTDVSISNLTAFLDATAQLAPFYVGGTLAYVSGNDPNNTTQQTGGTLNGGTDWNPCLILFSYYDLTNWVGPVYGYNSTAPTAPGKAGTSMVDGPMSNAWFFQGRVGVKPISDLDIMLSISYAEVDKEPTANGKPSSSTNPLFVGGTYGTEVDLTGNYKITNNLSYMLGFGYLFTGDYFKGTSGSNQVDNDYLLINKLTLTF